MNEQIEKPKTDLNKDHFLPDLHEENGTFFASNLDYLQSFNKTLLSPSKPNETKHK